MSEAVRQPELDSPQVTTAVAAAAPTAAGSGGDGATAAAAGRLLPLCVDLDGTLIKTDLLYESTLLLIKANPFYLFLLPLWLLRGKAYFKQEVCRRVTVDVGALPYHKEFVAFLREEHARGRQIVLATAADQGVAGRIAEHLGVFDAVIASDGCSNMSGAQKLAALVDRFGAGNFDYAGNARPDLKVWGKSHRAIVVNPSGGIGRRAASLAPVERSFEDRPPALRTLVKAVRVHQWVKNVLIFVPLLTSHQVTNLNLLAAAVGAFMAFSLVASSAYLLNDLLDLQADRYHHKKHKRPLAAGNLSILAGLALMFLLLAGGAVISLFLPPLFRAVLAFYYVFTLVYSLALKRRVLLDVYALGALYTIRVIAGAAAEGVMLSAWLLAFSMFLFVSLALVKRFAELRRLGESSEDEQARGRNYRATDMQALGSLGTGSGFMCVLVLALYIQSPQVEHLYKTPAALWLLCPLMMYWISRVWVVAYRGKMNADPVLFALTDGVSYLVGICGAAVIFVASMEWRF